MNDVSYISRTQATVRNLIFFTPPVPSNVTLYHEQQFLLSHSADPDLVNSVGETADRVSGAGPEAFELLQEARRRKQGVHPQGPFRLWLWPRLKYACQGFVVPRVGGVTDGVTASRVTSSGK